MDKVTVVIPTLSRQAGLARAIDSIKAQVAPHDVTIDVVVVDNSSDADAQDVVAACAEGWQPITYISEPRPGVSNARNAGVAAATGRWIAFLDDDEEATPHWIAAMVEVARETGADAVFGPVEAKHNTSGAASKFERYFSREIDKPASSDITDLAAYLGTNNSMFLRERCFVVAQPFDVRLNSVGGEDSLLLKKLVRDGRRLAWAPEAKVVETVPERRLNWEYVRRRKFLSGQIRVFVNYMIEPVAWAKIGFWMLIGAIQVCVGFAGAAIMLPFDATKSQRLAVIGYSGLGKVLWMPAFRPKLYGSGHVS